MENIYNRLIVKNKYKRLLCVETEKIGTLRYLPKIIRNFMFKGLLNNEKVILFIDSVARKYIKKMFNCKKNFITRCFDNGILDIKYYNSSNTNNLQFLNMLNIVAKAKKKIWVVWDFEFMSENFIGLNKFEKYVEDIFSYSNKNVNSIIYMYNSIYSFSNIKKFLRQFDVMLVESKKSEFVFYCKYELEKAIVWLKSSQKLICEDDTILSFNSMFSIPKIMDKNKFSNIVIDKLKGICNVDFCIICTLNKEKDNVYNLDDFSGITKQDEYYLVNSIKSLKIKQGCDFCQTILMDIETIQDKSMKECFSKIGIKSCAAIFVKYYDIVEGIICIGRYESFISKFDMEYIQSICKAAFYIIQHHNMNSSLKNKLIESEKYKLTGEVGVGIAHDMNNVLTPIIGCIQILKDNIKDKNLLKQLKIIEICAYDGMNITEKVKKIIRQYNKHNMEIFNIDDLIIDAVELTKNKWLMESAADGIKISMVISAKSKAKIKGNPTEIREVFINIIRNCVDAMPNGGTISIDSKCVDKKVISRINDNGIGMNKEIVKKIFNPFFTTKGNKGSGLGLSVSNKIIKSHHGNIKVFSKENIGTTFEIELPVSEENISIKNNVIDKKINFRGNILIIDDVPQIRNVISDMIKSLTNCKIKNCGCENIKQEIYRRRYDIVICDFSMPDINGLQVADMVKNLYKDSYFCLMTGWIGNFKKDKINKVDFILSKPVSKEKIRELFVDYNNMKS